MYGHASIDHGQRMPLVAAGYLVHGSCTRADHSCGFISVNSSMPALYILQAVCLQAVPVIAHGLGCALVTFSHGVDCE